jgi:hypothetical protein
MGKMKDLHIIELNGDMRCPFCNNPVKLIKKRTPEDNCSGVVPTHWLCERCKKAFPLNGRKKKYFVTVDWCDNWCDKGKRGIFCNRDGTGFFKDIQHTEKEMRELLGLFFLILNPKSEPFTENELKRFTKWKPLAEYQHQYGIAIEEVKNEVSCKS